MTQPSNFRHFFDTQSRPLLRAAWLLTGDWATAEDLVQTTLVITWQRWAQIDTSAPEAYARKVMVNTYLRWRKRRWLGERATDPLPPVIDDAEQFAEVEDRQILLAALRHLPPRQRAVIVLRFFADLTEAQVADTLNCSVGAVKSHAAKALARLRAMPSLDDIPTGGPR